ncbi:MAG TPA: sigma-70 family RNA polymerase sigma factor [Acidimicrobiales bacterium]|nr:sigma-70 family RNA polymerase sigma factor [Acidimicrobiales bacterium]
MKRAAAPTSAFASLLASAKQGGERAWTELYNELSGPVLGYLRLQGASEPDDLLGEVFLHIARKIGTFQGDAAGFRSWVFMVAHNRIVDERRRRGRRPVELVTPEQLEPVKAAVDVEAAALRSLGIDTVNQLLAGLTPDQRAVLHLRIVGGFTVEEIARILGKPSGAVKALQRRALSSLRRDDSSAVVSP